MPVSTPDSAFPDFLTNREFRAWNILRRDLLLRLSLALRDPATSSAATRIRYFIGELDRNAESSYGALHPQQIT